MTTVHVRIAVAIRSSTHEWTAVGSSDEKDADMRRGVVDCFDPGDPISVVWVEADVPLPEELTVAGAVPEEPNSDFQDAMDHVWEQGRERGYAEGLRDGRAEERPTDGPIPF